MSARIDHVGWAEGFVDAALAPFDPNEPPIEGDARDEPTVSENLAFAQVHATLALVEQQRIANLIAAFQMEGGPYKVPNSWTDGTEDANVRIPREIREALGLA